MSTPPANPRRNQRWRRRAPEDIDPLETVSKAEYRALTVPLIAGLKDVASLGIDISQLSQQVRQLEPLVTEVKSLKDTVVHLVAEIESLKIEMKRLRNAGYQGSLAPLDASLVVQTSIKYILATTADRELIADKKLTNERILNHLHQWDSDFRKIEKCKYIKPKVANKHSGNLPCLIFTVKDWESELKIRNKAAQIGKALELSTDCYLLKPRYMVHVVDLDSHQHFGNKLDIETLAQQIQFPEGIELKAKVTFKRLILETSDLTTALNACRYRLKILGLVYRVVPFPATGSPLFCLNCQRANHFQEECGNPTRCGRCAGEHITEGCYPAKLKCPNCGGEHKAWDRQCNNKDSAEQHRRADYSREKGPAWGEMLKQPTSDAGLSSSSPNVQKRGRGRPRKQGGPSSQEVEKKDKSKKQNTPPSSQEVEKKGVGRPRKSGPDLDPKQRLVNSYWKSTSVAKEGDSTREDIGISDADEGIPEPMLASWDDSDSSAIPTTLVPTIEVPEEVEGIIMAEFCSVEESTEQPTIPRNPASSPDKGKATEKGIGRNGSDKPDDQTIEAQRKSNKQPKTKKQSTDGGKAKTSNNNEQVFETIEEPTNADEIHSISPEVGRIRDTTANLSTERPSVSRTASVTPSSGSESSRKRKKKEFWLRKKERSQSRAAAGDGSMSPQPGNAVISSPVSGSEQQDPSRTASEEPSAQDKREGSPSLPTSKKATGPSKKQRVSSPSPAVNQESPKNASEQDKREGSPSLPTSKKATGPSKKQRREAARKNN
ncbi:hypothetical protein FGRMN_11135 [Fusarium graminum]|nr:hypothetical protein FGRMN_11135 [Fusarium graminum]